MSFRNSKVVPRRTQSLKNSYNSSSYHRPTSLVDFLDSKPYNPYLNNYSTSNFSSTSFNPYSLGSSKKNFPTSYGGALNGYGSISVPSKNLTALNIIQPYSVKSHQVYNQKR